MFCQNQNLLSHQPTYCFIYFAKRVHGISINNTVDVYGNQQGAGETCSLVHDVVYKFIALFFLFIYIYKLGNA